LREIIFIKNSQPKEGILVYFRNDINIVIKSALFSHFIETQSGTIRNEIKRIKDVAS
tara:strand:+ start:844 stop:1014 length:171 start_codon:yes stop_codon:yes gene_type:complete